MSVTPQFWTTTTIITAASPRSQTMVVQVGQRAQWRRLRWWSCGLVLLLLAAIAALRQPQPTLIVQNVPKSSSSSSSHPTEQPPLPPPSGRSDQQQPQRRILLATYLFSDEDDDIGSNSHNHTTSTSTLRHTFLRLFLKTAATSGVDVCLVGNVRSLMSLSDDHVLPANVKFHYISWDDFVNLAASRIGFNGTVLRESRNYYKINDFKPAFGYLFADLLHGYDWWGAIDNDILLGDVRRLVHSYYLENFDVIGGLPYHPTWGPFTMYRNTQLVNTLFLNASLPHQDLFGVPFPTWFDEWQRYGPYEHIKGATISGIIERHRDVVRLAKGVGFIRQPIVDGIWGDCGWDESHPLPRCVECAYLTTSSSANKPRLLHRISLIGTYRETLLCHYQMSKHLIQRQMLEHPDLVDQLLGGKEEPGEFRVNAIDGLQPILAADKWSLVARDDPDLIGPSYLHHHRHRLRAGGR
jgi:hypothetical protein